MQRVGRWAVGVALAGALGCDPGPSGGGEGSTAATAGASQGPARTVDPGDPVAAGDRNGGGPALAEVATTGAPSRVAGAAVIAATDPGADAAAPGDPGGATGPGPLVAADPMTAGATTPYWTGNQPNLQAPPAAPGPLAAITGPSAGELAELMAGIHRKMSHDDGEGCLADLERARQIDAKLMATMGILEAQCLMLVGQCQRGKRMVADYYKDQTNMTEERAVITAESIGSMRCRGGDMSARDQLLGALFELSDGAYMNPRTAKFCAERIATIRRLGPKVKPQGPDDTQVSGGLQALFYTGAACLARAGDCDGAFRAFWHDFPKEGLAAIQDPAMAREVVESAFRSGIERCKDAKLPLK